MKLIKSANKIDKAGIDFIKKWESFRSVSYLDSVNVWTVGYGSTRINGRPVRKGDVVTAI